MIRLKNLTLDIKGEYLFSVDDYSFEAGKKVLLVGDNGTGKSSLMKSLINHFPFVEGDIETDAHIIYQPQEPYLFQRTVRDNLRLSKMTSQQMEEGLDYLFADDILDKRVRVLSGGQRQKTALLRSIYKAKEVLLLDEPFSQMDEKSSIASQKLVDLWFKEDPKRVLVMISHDVELQAIDFHEKIILRDQKFIVEKLDEIR